MRQLRNGLVILIACLMYAVTAEAKMLAQAQASHSSISLESEMLALPAGETAWLAVRIVPRAGWHAYWKNSGDSGAAPIFEWTSGVSVGAAQFPAPKRLPTGPLVNFGYDGPTTFLVPVQVGAQAASFSGTLEAEWLICEVECVPQLAILSFDLPVGDGQADENASSLFAQARLRLPEPAYWDADLTVATDLSTLRVYMSAAEAEKVSGAYFFPAGEGVANYSADQTFDASADGLVISIPRGDGAPEVTNANGVLRVDFEGRGAAAYELEPSLQHVKAVRGPEPVIASIAVGMPLWEAAFFAIIGGLILNLMPCVFPILSLKAFAFVSANYKTAANRKREGWAYTAGIWISFMLIVGVLLLLRAGGTSVGWGFQLQEPVFVGLMAILMVVVALSLSGMFSIQFGVEGAGQSFAAREGTSGAFFKGVLAALVATPCTAPFMAPAIGFALTQPLVIVLLVFSCLAFGLALPFLLLSYSPAIARIMPKPGPWMEKVKEFLAFPMYLTAAWLVYIFNREAGEVGAFVLLASIIGVVFAIWLGKQGQGRVLRGFAWLVAALSIALLSVKPWQVPVHDPDSIHVAEVPYSDEALSKLLAERRPVFAYFTADWCITCKVNERLAIETKNTQQALTDSGSAVLKGDWTNRNAEIGSVLARHGRAGVPLYLYYPSGAQNPIVLPEILGPNTVSDLIRRYQE